MFSGGGAFSFFDLAFVLCIAGRFKDGEIDLLLCFVVIVDGAGFNESKIFISAIYRKLSSLAPREGIFSGTPKK